MLKAVLLTTVLLIVLSIVEGPVKLKLQGDTKIIAAINDALKYRVPNYWRSDTYQIWKHSDGKRGWDGYNRPIKFVPRANPPVAGTFRGWLEDILRVCRDNNFVVDTSRLLPLPFSKLVTDDLPDDLIQADFDLDDNQREGICQWLRHAMGINNVTVNGGKTAMFCAAGAFIKRHYPNTRILYLVPTERLVKQAVENARGFLPDWDIGQYGGGKHDLDAVDMVVATGASAGINFDDKVKQGWYSSFSTLFCDESHRVAGPTMQAVTQAVPAFFRFGASDSTKADDPVAFANIKGILGPIRQKVCIEPLISMGRAAKPYIYLVDIPEWKNEYRNCQHSAPLDTKAWILSDGKWTQGLYKGPAVQYDDKGEILMMEKRVTTTDEFGKPVFKCGILQHHKELLPVQNPGWHIIEGLDHSYYEVESRWCLLDRLYDTAIIRNKKRNALIAEWAEYFSKQDKQTLIVCTRTLHILILEDLIKRYVPSDKVRILFSKNTATERDETFDWLRNTPGAILITPLVKEGVSINEIRAGVIADHIVGWEVANQILGRFLRKKPKAVENNAEVVWFIDRMHPRMARNSLALFKALEKIRGYTYYFPCSNSDSIALATRYDAVDMT